MRFRSKLWLMVVITTMALASFSTTTSETASQKPLRGIVIVIDPGHGGIDDGSRAGGRFLEKDINLKVAQETLTVLTEMGAEVFLTRESDVSLSRRNQVYTGRHREDLSARARFINESPADYWISIHCNSCPGHPNTRGPVVYYNKKTDENKLFAGLLQERLNNINLSHYGVKQKAHEPTSAAYFILRNTAKPGALIEIGYLTSPTDLFLITQTPVQRQIAVAIALGIVDAVRALSTAKPGGSSSGPALRAGQG